MTKPFDSLTVNGQARRLRALAWNALAHYDLPVARLRLVTNDFNAIFRVDTQDGRKYLLRVALPSGGHGPGQFTSEMAWLHALARETELTVPAPLKTRSGDWLALVETPGVPEARWCMLFDWLPGQPLGERLNQATVSQFGRLSARLHQHTQTFRPSGGFEILRFDRPFPFKEPVVLFDDAFREDVPPEWLELFQRALEWGQDALNRLTASGEPMRVLHGDLHAWNVHLYRGRLLPFDFEDLMWGWPAQDIATTLYYWARREDYPDLLRWFRAGYETLTPWPERSPDEIEAFIALRGLGLANFILQDPNPEWQAETPAFLARTEALLLRLLESTPDR